MSDVMWVALLSGGFLVVMFLRAVVHTFRRAGERLDQLVEDELADIDCERWDAEMASRSPMVDDDGWLR